MNIKHCVLLFWSLLSLGCSDDSGQGTSANDRYRKPDYATRTPDYLDQHWDHATRMQWWYTSQGSRILPYAWFLALEQPANEQLISAAENLEALRFVAWPADPKWNPDGLPIGFVADADAAGHRYLGVTCAACHTSKVAYQGKQAIIEGGPAHHDFDRFISEIALALKNTIDNRDKFARFAVRVLGKNEAAADLADLQNQMSQLSSKLGQRVSVNHPPHPNGYARLDAFGNIFNEVGVATLNEPSNAHLANAPVSYPMLWDTPQHDVVQWNGSAPNAGIGPEVRNVGEAVGVFGDLGVQVQTDAQTGLPAIKVSHHIQIQNQIRLEGILKSLWSPLWPEKLLPAINQKKAAAGKQLFDANCVRCHANIQRDDPARQIKAKMIPVAEIGTDPLTAMNIQTHQAKTGLLAGQPILPLASLPNLPKFGAEAPSAELVNYGVLGILAEGLPPAVLAKGLPAFLAAAQQNSHPPSYKARPLNGVWAAAPYLHNGSVPNLWELLQKPEQRATKFNVGSWEIDPVKVGFVSHAEAETSEFDTHLPGNTNQGHVYGTALSDKEKWDLLEYLKSL